MNDINKFFEEAITEWNNNKAKGSVIIPPPYNDKCMVLAALHRIYGKSINFKVAIIVEDFKSRSALIHFIAHNDFDDDRDKFKEFIENKTIRILTSDFIENKRFSYLCDVCIIYNVLHIGEFVAKILENSNFNLSVYSSVLTDPLSSARLYRYSPPLNAFKQAELDAARVNPPVEEMVVSLVMEEGSKEDKLYKYYTEFIETSLIIFGDFDTLEYARKGNPTTNESCTEICNRIAEFNGWSRNLDMSSEYNIKVDELYNPNSLAERAEETYRKIRDRKILVAEYSPKIDKAIEIINKHPNEKILIINKTSTFAELLTAYVNNNSETNIAGGYHDGMKPIPKLDGYGRQEVYRSGLRKGVPIELKAKAQCTANEKAFNAGEINVLVTANAPNPKLSIDVDVVIITSPLCNTIKDYIYRLNNVKFNNEKLKLYTLYILGTIEERKIKARNLESNHVIVNKNEFDEESCANFIVE